jgi:hypothetical protein
MLENYLMPQLQEHNDGSIWDLSHGHCIPPDLMSLDFTLWGCHISCIHPSNAQNPPWVMVVHHSGGKQGEPRYAVANIYIHHQNSTDVVVLTKFYLGIRSHYYHHPLPQCSLSLSDENASSESVPVHFILYSSKLLQLWQEENYILSEIQSFTSSH